VRRETGTGIYVESNVSILADPSKEEFNAAIRLDLLLIGVALRDEVLGVSIKDMNILGRDIH
jgi:hypothetical protein